ncbi:MAG: MFS transporter [Nitriliruptoraceae bacterium]
MASNPPPDDRADPSRDTSDRDRGSADASASNAPESAPITDGEHPVSADRPAQPQESSLSDNRPKNQTDEQTDKKPDSGSNRGSFRLLADPSFGPYFFGKLVSMAGIWIYNIAAAIVVYEMTQSTVLVGAVSVLQFLPQIIIGPLSGARADRTANRRRQILVGRAIVALGSGGVAAILWLTGLDGYEGAILIVLSAGVVGTGFAVGGPAMQSILPALVQPRELPTAIALDTFPITIARTAGPALGALIVVNLGGNWAFALGALTSLLYLVVVQLIRIRPVPRKQPQDGSVRGAVRYLKVDRGLPLLLFGVAAVGVAADPVITLTPAIADDLGGDAVLVGSLASAFGAGSAAMFIVLGQVRRRLGIKNVATIGLSLIALGTAGLIWRSSPATAMAALAVTGAGTMAAITTLSTQIQQRVPEELRGRVMALWAVAFLGVRPFAAGINSVLADFVTIDAALALVTVVVAAATFMTRSSRIPGPPTSLPATGTA